MATVPLTPHAGSLRKAAIRNPELVTLKMSNANRLTFTGRIRSFRCAIRGIRVMIASQHNAWIHAAFTVAVICLGVYFRLSRSEWCWLILAFMAVWIAEALNTAFEFLTDVASPEFHPLAEKAKDVAAGAVLIAAIGAVILGLIVLGPHALVLARAWR